MPRKRRTIEQKIADANQALFRARNGQSIKNDIAVMAAFTDRGIPAETIDPRENVFTYNIWLYATAGGFINRQVRKGEKSVKVLTFYDDEKTKQKKVTRAALFHVSQTDAIV